MDARAEERYEQNHLMMMQMMRQQQSLMMQQMMEMTAQFMLQQSPTSPSPSVSMPCTPPDAAAPAKANSVSSHASSASGRATDFEDDGRYDLDEEEAHDAATPTKANSVSSHASSASGRATDFEDGARLKLDEKEAYEPKQRGCGDGYG